MAPAEPWTPQAFAICSDAQCHALLTGDDVIDPTCALPVTPGAWQRLQDGKLAPSNDASADQPWWLQLQADDALATAAFYVSPQLPCFVGHFPGQPLLPGVIQLEWAVRLTARLWPQTLPAARFAGLSRLKFKAPITPGAVLAMDLKCTGTDTNSPAQRSVQLSIHATSQTFTSARLNYRD